MNNQESYKVLESAIVRKWIKKTETGSDRSNDGDLSRSALHCTFNNQSSIIFRSLFV